MEHTDSGIPDELAQNTDSSKSASDRGASSRTRRRTRRRKADAGRYMIARLLVLVCLVLVVFEGNVIYRLFSHRVGTSVEIMNSKNEAQTEGILQNSADSDPAVSTMESSPSTGSNPAVAALAGGDLIEDAEDPSPAPSDQPAAEAPAVSQVQTQPSEAINSDKVVPLRETAVDDSFFRNSVFIGDSRMEGFRNASGITEGTFLTGVGLAVNDMDKQIISTANGNISVYQGLSGTQYDRIYLMLGANDLGYYPWEDFPPTFEAVLKKFHELQPGAIIYVCSVIYVDESKIAAGFEYDNNDNVRTINGYLLDACEKLWYSYYLNLNEIFSDGYGELISDASPDGIHLYPKYLEMMLDYLRTHYLTDEEFAAEAAAHPEDSAIQSSSAKEDPDDSSDTQLDASDSPSDASGGKDESSSDLIEEGDVSAN